MRILLPLAGLMLFSTCFHAPAVFAAEPLSLAEAEAQAIERDAERSRFLLEAEAESERAVAAGSLPDPELRLGAVNLPVDSFALDAEPMTQLVVGIRQMLPPGDTLDLRTERGRHLAEAIEAAGEERARLVRYAVRKAWFEARLAADMLARIERVRREVAPLIDAARSRYATGGGRQADFLAASLRLERLHDRALQAEERNALARATLGRWLDELPDPLPPARLQDLRAFDALVAGLDQHPLVRAASARVAASEAGEGIAREAFGPQWGLDFSYGHRRGVDAAGADRPDFASAMVTVSLPLFTGNRQAREVSAARRETRAAEYGRLERRRELEGRLDVAWRRHSETARQLELVTSELLPRARRAREATMDAYADNAVPFVDLVETETDLLELELRQLELRERLQVARAELAYLAGEPQ